MATSKLPTNGSRRNTATVVLSTGRSSTGNFYLRPILRNVLVWILCCLSPIYPCSALTCLPECLDPGVCGRAEAHLHHGGDASGCSEGWKLEQGHVRARKWGKMGEM